MNMIPILLTGCNGQLGREIMELAVNYPKLQIYPTDIEDLDICSFTALDDFTQKHNFKYLINCAAYTNVDQAENEIELANKINADAVKNIATISNQKQIIPIHISTDYVFSGEANTPYKEDDTTHPLGIYGKSKLLGESHLRHFCDHHIIIRTSWLYSPFGKNFLKTMINLGKEKREIGVIDDQIGSPTYAHDLANSILKIIEQINSNPDFTDYGTYHYANLGVCSWYDFAHEIQIECGNNCKVKAIETKDFKTLSQRPHFSVLNKSKIKHIFDLDIPHWRGRISHCINRIIS